MTFSQMLAIRSWSKKLALKLEIQTYQILTNDDEVCIPSLSSILLAVSRHGYETNNWYLSSLNQIQIRSQTGEIDRHRNICHLLAKLFMVWSEKYDRNRTISLKKMVKIQGFYSHFLQIFYRHTILGIFTLALLATAPANCHFQFQASRIKQYRKL